MTVEDAAGQRVFTQGDFVAAPRLASHPDLVQTPDGACSVAELTGRTTPTEHGFRINVSHLRRPNPPWFYQALITLLGLQNVAPAPHEVEAVQIEARGELVHVEMLLVDGRLAVADVPLETRIRML